jgi:hypothetical protein
MAPLLPAPGRLRHAPLAAIRKLNGFWCVRKASDDWMSIADFDGRLRPFASFAAAQQRNGDLRQASWTLVDSFSRSKNANRPTPQGSRRFTSLLTYAVSPPAALKSLRADSFFSMEFSARQSSIIALPIAGRALHGAVRRHRDRHCAPADGEEALAAWSSR